MTWLKSVRLWSGKPPVSSETALKTSQPPSRSAGKAGPSGRLEAIAAVGQEPSPSETQMLLDTLADPDARLRLAAAQALQHQADPAHLAHFSALLTDEHFEVRTTAIQFLGRIQNAGVAPLVVPLLADSDSDVRRAAALALGQVRDPIALEPLVLALTDQEPAVRQAAVAALEQIDRRWVRSNAAQRAIPRLEALRQDPQPWIGAAAQKVLEKLREAQGKDTEFWNRESGIRNL